MGPKRTALITGATSGIGASFAKRLAREGYDLILTGRRMEKLNSLAEDLRRSAGIEVECVEAELSRPADAQALVDLAEASRGIEFLVNNAGFGNSKDYGEDPIENQLAMLTVHNSVPVRLIHAVLPRMLAAGRGSIINVSSLASFLPTPGSPMYGSTKAFLTSLSVSLFARLLDKGVRVQALCPGYVWTDFHEKIGIERERQKSRGLILWMDSDKVVAASMRALSKSKPICVPGAANRLLRRFVALSPLGLIVSIMRRQAAV